MVCGARALPCARSPAELDALVLCGGLGTRLRGVLPDAPKSLARVGGRPFLEILLESLASAGVRRFVLCTGHGADAIEAALPALRRFGRVDVSREEQPLGTGGAVRRALSLAAHSPLLVVNGDSLCRVDLAAMLARHRERGAALTLAAVSGHGRADVGNLRVDASGCITAFAEKSGAPGGPANAGVYLIEPRALEAAVQPGAAFSLERDWIPALAPGRAYAFEIAGPLLDIGTPERLHAAAAVLRALGLPAGCEGEPRPFRGAQ